MNIRSNIVMPLLVMGLTSCATSPTVAETYIERPDWTFSDNFEGDVNTQFWSPVRQAFHNAACEGGPSSGTLRFDYLGNYGPANDTGVSEVGDAWAERKFNIPIQATQLEISYDLYIPKNYVAAVDNHKALMLWSGDYGVIKSNVTVHHGTLGAAAGASGGATPSFNIGMDGKNFGHAMRADKAIIWPNHAGKWQRMHHYVELATGPGDYGRADIWRNGELIHSTHSSQIRPAYTGAPKPSESIRFSERGNYLNRGYLLGWANDLNNTETVSLCVDNFSIKARKAVGATVTTQSRSTAAEPTPPELVDVQ